MRHVSALVLTLLSLSAILGCTSTNISNLNVAQQTVSGCVDIYVHDDRPYILDGDKSPDFIGIVRAGYGNAFDFNTSNKASLASELGQSLNRALSSGQARVEYKDNVRYRTTGSQQCKSLVLAFKEWKIDAYINASFGVDSELKVYSNNGKLLASSNQNRKVKVKGSVWNPVAAAGRSFAKETESTISLPPFERTGAKGFEKLGSLDGTASLLAGFLASSTTNSVEYST